VLLEVSVKLLRDVSKVNRYTLFSNIDLIAVRTHGGIVNDPPVLLLDDIIKFM
jgi:hypothetical protein